MAKWHRDKNCEECGTEFNAYFSARHCPSCKPEYRKKYSRDFQENIRNTMRAAGQCVRCKEPTSVKRNGVNYLYCDSHREFAKNYAAEMKSRKRNIPVEAAELSP